MYIVSVFVRKKNNIVWAMAAACIKHQSPTCSCIHLPTYLPSKADDTFNSPRATQDKGKHKLTSSSINRNRHNQYPHQTSKLKKHHPALKLQSHFRKEIIKLQDPKQSEANLSTQSLSCSQSGSSTPSTIQTQISQIRKPKARSLKRPRYTPPQICKCANPGIHISHPSTPGLGPTMYIHTYSQDSQTPK